MHLRVGIILLVALLAGCASRPQGPPPAALPVRTADGYLARPAAALAWTPPAAWALDADELDAALARAGRGPQAVLGYDSPAVETLHVIVVDDQDRWRWGWGWGGWVDDYDRRAISTREFVRQR